MGAGPSDNFYLVKTDASGVQQWSNNYGTGNDDECYAAQQTSDGGYIVVGYTTQGTIGGRDIYAVKLDSSGNLDPVWTVNPCCFGSTTTDEGYAVWQTTDGGYVIAGTTNPPGTSYYDFYLVKVSSTGSQLWTRTYDGDGRSDEAHSVRQTADGGFIVGGRMSYAAGDYDFFLVRTDVSGNQLWEYSYGPDTNEEGYGVQ
jgi:hypothetical protein